jgi:hypothetical protein
LGHSLSGWTVHPLAELDEVAIGVECCKLLEPPWLLPASLLNLAVERNPPRLNTISSVGEARKAAISASETPARRSTPMRVATRTCDGRYYQ